jgi:hypothetical protein
VQESAPANTLGLHGAFTNTLTTSYITRGVLLENQGAIYQNVGELYFTLDDAPKITGIVGMFNSVHSEHTGVGSVSGATLDSTVEDWFEFDFWAGVSIDVTDKLNLSALYQEFHSPNDAFGVCKNVQLKLGYNDTDWWGKSGFALHPYALIFDELEGKAGTGPDEGYYVEVGVGPSWTFGSDGKYPLTLSIPISAGFGFGGFYTDNEEFGYVSAGAVVSVPMAFIPAKYGAWTFSSGVYYYYFGPGVDTFNTAIGSDDNYIIVGTAGVSLAF